ncbi:MAG: hypothetical protein ABSH33_13470 [Steroidobacteraceae bacterium]
MKFFGVLALLLPAWCLAQSPFAGTWTLQPELTTFGEDHPMVLMIERGTYKRSDCAPPFELPADGTDQPVKDEPLFDIMSVRLVDRRRVDVVQKLAGKVTWKGVYTVSKDQRSMTLEFDDERPSTPVTGTILYSRIGNPLSAAHALSGSWRPDQLTKLSASGSSMTIADNEHGFAVSWSDGRTAESHLDAKYYPLNGYLPGAQVSVLHSRPDTLAINREQGIAPVEVSRAVLSDDGQTMTYKQVDWICRALTTYIYHKKSAP